MIDHSGSDSSRGKSTHIGPSEFSLIDTAHPEAILGVMNTQMKQVALLPFGWLLICRVAHRTAVPVRWSVLH